MNDISKLIPLVEGPPNADASRIATVEVSRGGMMTYLVLTRTDEVKECLRPTQAAVLTARVYGWPVSLRTLT
ncbi:MAG: hypothetical protein GTO63_16445 [Anaerolineae bacterium]|nr:hypothetical protein [Anaerolineae bacterium]NIN96403.1 hypothetical protein [Anaerolineae bacterium]NIQ79439.1 hypothetical protein [Anaerolineae bacterium]